MLDARLLPIQHRLLMPLARALKARGVGADQVTLVGFATGLAAVALLAWGHFAAALLALAINRAADGLDGVLARLSKATDRGAFLDITLDFVFYALFPLGFALADPAQNALPAAVLITSFMGTGSSFLAFAVIAAKQGRSAAAFPSKGIHYLGGLTEGAETIAVFAAMCLWPLHFPILAYLFAAACALTTVLRWHQGWTAFSKP